jgi:hypothetical protein
MHIRMHIHMRIHMLIHIHIHMHMHMHIHVHMHTFVLQPSDVYLVNGNTSQRIPRTLAAVHVNGAKLPIPPMHPSTGSTGWLGLPLVFSYVLLLHCCTGP